MPNSEPHIECPKYAWKPDGQACWQCDCGHIWNTFDTYRQCPTCSKVHKLTQCPACAEKSPHPDWYKDLSDIDLHLSEIIGAPTRK